MSPARFSSMPASVLRAQRSAALRVLKVLVIGLCPRLRMYAW
jgi:hypothetical protein